MIIQLILFEIKTRLHLLRVIRVNIALTLAITAPVATILFLKFGRLSIFDGIKIGGNTDNILKNELLNYIPLFSLFPKKTKNTQLDPHDTLPFPRSRYLKNNCNLKKVASRQGRKAFIKEPIKGGGNPKALGKGGNRATFLKKIKFILFIIICVGLYKYNIFNYIINILNIYFLFYLWFLILIFSLAYNSIGYFILINKEIDIDLKKIRVKFIRKNIESFIAIRNSKIEKEKMKKYFISQLYFLLFLGILSGFLILI